MTNHTIYTSSFVPEFVDALEKILTRMGWMPERDSDQILVTVPCEDDWVYNWLILSIQ